jgi:hypothetical protein
LLLAVEPRGERRRDEIEQSSAKARSIGRCPVIQAACELTGQRRDQRTCALITWDAYRSEVRRFVAAEGQQLTGEYHRDHLHGRHDPVDWSRQVHKREVAWPKVRLAPILLNDPLPACQHVNLGHVQVGPADVAPTALRPARTVGSHFSKPYCAGIADAQLILQVDSAGRHPHLKRAENLIDGMLPIFQARGRRKVLGLY